MLEEMERNLIALCIQTAARRKSALTQYVHLHCQDSSAWDTIPVYENFCYVLGLLRTRTSESVLEAKGLLERLLSFEVAGNFPIYLHDFPRCHRRSLGIQLLPVLSAIVRHFSGVLGQAVIDRIEEVMQRIATLGEEIHRDRPLPDAVLVKWLAYVNPEALIHFEPRLESAEEWADYWIAVQEAFAQGAQVKGHFHRVCALWNPKSHLFLGPQFFERGEPEVTLFDLAMGSVFGTLSKRALEAAQGGVYLQASLLWAIKGLSEALIPSRASQEVIEDRLSRTLFFQEESRLCSFSIQVDESLVSQFFEEKKLSDGPYRVEYSFNAPMEEREEEEIPISFFWSFGKTTRIEVNGVLATVFRLGDTVSFFTPSQKIQMRLENIAGEGDFLGRISLGNRPSSRGPEGLWDWKVIVRTLRRSAPCTLRLNLQRVF